MCSQVLPETGLETTGTCLMPAGMASRLIFKVFSFPIKIGDLFASFSVIQIPEFVALLLDSVIVPMATFFCL